MDLYDIKNLKTHDRIKFVGDSLDYNASRKPYDVHEPYNEEIPLPKFLKKGKKYVISSVDVGLHFYRAQVNKVVPEDWELVEKRHEEVTTNIRNSQGLRGAQRTLDRIRSDIKEHIEQQHKTFNTYLDQITLPEKLKYLSELKGEDKVLADLLFEFKDMSILLREWDKGRDRDH